jgi:hypothetical protein
VTPPPPDPDPNVWKSSFEEILEQVSASPTHDLGASEVRPDPTFGKPGQDCAFWEGKQQLPDDRAIECQQSILAQDTGHPLSEATLVCEAVDQGWHAPGHATRIADVGNLLERHDVAVTRYGHADPFHLAEDQCLNPGCSRSPLFD